jgi:phage protein U
MIGIMMMLGSFKFSLSTAAYETFSHSTAYRWQAQERFGQLPAQQYTGPGEESITLSGVIFPQLAGGLHQVDSMRYYGSQGRPLQLVDGNGYVWGKWCILSVDENKEVFFSDGTARKQTFNMKICRYVDDIPGTGTGSGNNWKIQYQGTRPR